MLYSKASSHRRFGEKSKGANEFMIRIYRTEQVILCAASLIMIMLSTMTSDGAGGRDGSHCVWLN